jgi:hypothetical protein
VDANAAAQHSHAAATHMSDDEVARIARLQRLLGKLEQVSKQASDLDRMAKELHQEAHDSIRLAIDATRDVARKRPRKKRMKRRKRR